MPRIRYLTKRFSAPAKAMIDQANEIIDEYTAQGFSLTLRQLYYQFVARGLIRNAQSEYKRLGGIVSDARLAGLIDWDAIEDRTRFLRSLSHWEDPADIVRSCAAQFRVDLWEGQPYRVEVWIEKDAGIGTIENVCNDNDVPYFSCRGYTSQSELWAAGRRLLSWRRKGYRTLVIHLGDHDPSGIDMTRDIDDRLMMFAEGPVEVRRIALNMDQVREYEPPPNPAKLTDSRCAKYIEEHGEESWELDALDPKVLHDLIQSEIDTVKDERLYDLRVKERDAGRAALGRVSDRWDDVLELVSE